MKKLTAAIIGFCLIFALAGCVPETPPSPSPSATPTSTTTPTPTPSASVEPSISPSPTETPPTFTPDTVDKAGEGGVMFDIYQQQAGEDLNMDATPEEITFTAGASNSKLSINGTEYTVNVPNLGQVFAITDVDTSDNWREIVFSEKYNASYGSDPEVKPTAFLFWWNGTKLIQMGTIGDAGFDGSWRTGFKCTAHFDGNKLVAGYAFSGHLTKIYYTAHYNPSGTERKLKEVNYPAKVLWTPNTLTLKSPVVLLAHADSTFFGSSYNVIWDYAGGEYTLGRGPNPGGDTNISMIPQTGETVTIVGVLGPNWVQLKTSDGKKGWIKVIDSKVQGYYQVMHITAADIFEGLASAG